MGRVLPILFNTFMVRAILDGRKTVTRRVVKPRSKKACGFYVTFRKSDNAFMGVYDYDENERQFDSSQTPPYQPGDILYVRETFRPLSNHPKAGFEYAADWSPKYFRNSKEPNCCNEGKWKPSIHMPKEAARIWLKVTDVRVEQLQDIRNFRVEGIEVSEGCNECFAVCGECNPNISPIGCDNEIEIFADLWDSTIKKSNLALYGWEANPWVWVIEFEQCEKPESEV